MDGPEAHTFCVKDTTSCAGTLPLLAVKQQRSKWKFKQPTVSAKEFVLTLNETQPGNNKWVLGQIESVSKGRDGLVCVVEVSTKEELL
ncbi:hypothetical protein DMENIID0001_144720 [Sergentomyia squamirostris]